MTNMDFNEKEQKLYSLFIRFIKEEGTYKKWEDKFIQNGTLEKTIKNCFRDRTTWCMSYDINGHIMSIPHNIYASDKGFGVVSVYGSASDANISSSRFVVFLKKYFVF